MNIPRWSRMDRYQLAGGQAEKPHPLEALANATNISHQMLSKPLTIATINTEGLGVDQVGARKQTHLKCIFERADSSLHIILL